MISQSQLVSLSLLAFLCVAVVRSDEQQEKQQEQRISQLEDELKTVKFGLADLKRVMLAFAVNHVGQYTDANEQEVGDELSAMADKRSDGFKFYGSRGKKSDDNEEKTAEKTKKEFSYLPSRGKRFYFQASRG